MFSLALAVFLGAVSEEAPVAPEEPVDAGVTESLAVVPPPEPEPSAFEQWFDGDHLTGNWLGARDWLSKRGFVVDFVYAGEVFANVSRPEPGANGAYTGHFDLAFSFDTQAAGLWPGGKFYVLGQNNHGTGINAFVGAASEVSNIEAAPYFQLGEFFIEQAFGDWLKVRVGKHDVNRDYGAPRFGGNFINNNFGMLASAPLPSYPTNGLGAMVSVQPIWWLVLKLSFMEGKPQIGSFGFDSALAPGAGHFVIASLGVLHHYGPENRHNGTTSITGFRQQGQFDELGDVPMPRTFTENYGFFVQHDEHFFLDAVDSSDPRSLNFIGRVGWSQPDRNQFPLFWTVSLAWHGLGPRRDDTIGVGVGGYTVTRQLGGTRGPGNEVFAEVFYKWRLTHFFSLQPDLQYYHSPGGDGPDALIVGLRLKAKL